VPLQVLQQAFAKMGIPAVDELLSKEEQDKVRQELDK
jgi:hypothetical protein